MSKKKEITSSKVKFRHIKPDDYEPVSRERSTDSPPLSLVEIRDLMQSTEEFKSEDLPVYDNAEDFIRSLMRERREHRASE